ncbi:MAG: transposase [Crocinitomicaceae bacterium]
MKRFYVGIDISKDWLDVAVLETDSKKIISEKRIDNNQKHIFKLINQLLKKGNADSYWFCFEHTGNYGLELMAFGSKISFIFGSSSPGDYPLSGYKEVRMIE